MTPGTDQGQDGGQETSGTWQWNLQTLLLLTASVAVWLGYICYCQQISRLKQQVEVMRQAATESVAEDPESISLVRQPEPWDDHDRWDIYLPEGDYVLRLATRNIDERGLAPVRETANITAGRHRIALHQDGKGFGQEFTVVVDGVAAIKIEETSTWDCGFHWSSLRAAIVTRVSPSEPAILLRLRNKAAGPTDGILLWIEHIDPTDSH